MPGQYSLGIEGTVLGATIIRGPEKEKWDEGTTSLSVVKVLMIEKRKASRTTSSDTVASERSAARKGRIYQSEETIS